MTKSEAQTRQTLIDKQLALSGWNIHDSKQVATEFCINKKAKEPTGQYCSSEFSDYALLGRNGKVIAVVEAKKTSVDARVGQEQAKQYCENIKQQEHSDLPFCFYSNGFDTYFWDIGYYPPRKIISFPTLDDLERLRYLRAKPFSLLDAPINTDIAGRDYQISAIRAVLESIEKKKRKSLLVMATGTGKTRTCIALIEALMRARRVQRVLFLVDRIALREQALRAFKEFLPDEPRWPNAAETQLSKDRRIYVSTYPTMQNIIRDETQPLSSHFFDLIIVDESHRSIYNTYGEILNYFDAIMVGLTATPTDVIDHNTFELFDCENGLPTFAYTYQQAIENNPPYLVEFGATKIETKFQQDGINKRTITLEDQKKLLYDGIDIEEINFEGTELEKSVTNIGTNTLIIREFMEDAVKDPNGVLPGKSIFFCLSKAHARRVEEIFNHLYPEYHGELARVIVSEDPRVYGKGGLLDQFTNNDMPRIAISVGMLDTGIDILEIVNLVFAKPVFSYTRFWQMIGRGTRQLDPKKIKPWCIKKNGFLILDCWNNFDYFKIEPKGKESRVQFPLPVRLVGLRLDKIEQALKCSANIVAEREIAKLRSLISQLPEQSVTIREATGQLNKVEADQFWLQLDDGKFSFLRHEIKPLFKSFSQTDFKALRFEMDVLEFSLERLMGHQQKADIIKSSIIEQISELPLTIGFINEHKTLIEASKTSSYWFNITEDQLDHLVNTLAPLMNFRSDGKGINSQTIVQLNLADEIKTKESIEFGPQNESININRYKEIVEAKIVELIDKNPILIKIKQDQVISELEINKLANDLHDEYPYITEALLRQVYNNRKARFIQFIRHILGIEPLKSFPDTVIEAFESFIKQHNQLTANQLAFLNLLKTYLIERENISRKDLISVPFTTLHPEGIRGVFSPEEINEILKLTEKLAA